MIRLWYIDLAVEYSSPIDIRTGDGYLVADGDVSLVPNGVASGVVRQARPVEGVVWNVGGDVGRAFEDGRREDGDHFAVEKLVAVGGVHRHDVCRIAIPDLRDGYHVVIDPGDDVAEGKRRAAPPNLGIGGEDVGQNVLRVERHPLRVVLVLPPAGFGRGGEALLFGGDDDRVGRHTVGLVVVEHLLAPDRHRAHHPILARHRVALHKPAADVGVVQQRTVAPKLTEHRVVDFREVADLDFDIADANVLVGNLVRDPDILVQPVHVDRTLPVLVRLVALPGKGHESLRRDVVERDTVEPALVDNARDLVIRGLEARGIALGIRGLEYPAQDVFELEVDGRLTLLAFEGDKIDAGTVGQHIVHRAAVGHPELVAGGGDAVVLQLRHFEVLVHADVPDVGVALDVQVAGYRAARGVEFLLQHARQPVHLLDGVRVPGCADHLFEVFSR